MSSKLLILRHGITEGNKNHWFYGGLDLPLIEEGKTALSEQRSAGIYPDVADDAQFFTTGMIRTEETLEVIFGERSHRVIRDLREMEFGEFEARTFDELKDEPAFNDWTYDGTGTVKFPGGESRNEFVERVEEGLKKLLEYHDEKISLNDRISDEVITVMICHGGVIATVMDMLFPGEKKEMWDWMPDPGCGYTVEIKEGVPISSTYIGKPNENQI